MSSSAVKLSDDLIKEARRYGEVYSRSIPRQIEYWSRIGKIAEENPDLPYSFIKEILIGQAEAAANELQPYTFG
jgi:hypothetical protein